MGEKGSLKNRIKEWKLQIEKIRKEKEVKEKEEEFLKQKCAEEKKEKEMITIHAVTTRFKNSLKFTFGMLFAAIEYICTESFKTEKLKKIEIKESRTNEELKEEIKEVEQEILTKKVESNEIKEDEYKKEEQLQNIENDILEKQSEEDSKEFSLQEEPKEEIKKEVEVPTKKSKLKGFAIDIEKEKKKTPLKPLEDKEQGQSIKETVNEDSKNKWLGQGGTNTVEPIKKVHKSKFIQEDIQLEPEESVYAKITQITEQLRELDKTLLIIPEQVKDEDEQEEEILHIKEEIEELKLQYQEVVKENENKPIRELEHIEEIDPYNLRYSGEEINQLSQKCDTELSKLKKQKIEEDFLVTEKELNILKTSIEENIKEQECDIDELKKLFNQAEIMRKRPTLVTGLHNFLSKTIDIGLSLLPLSLFKNKFVGILGSTIILNNRIRNMRKVIRKENKDINYITYKTIKESLKHQKSCIKKTQEVLQDSMKQLQDLKQEFIVEFYYDMDRYQETDDIMKEFSSIEYQITSKNWELEEMLETIKNTEEKEKQKIKSLEG